MKRIVKIKIALCLLCLSINGAYALQFSKPISGDGRIHTYIYDPNTVFIWKGFFRYASFIELDPEESVQTITMGDNTGWMINPAGNRIFLKPVEMDATTNMTVITDKRIYHFELYAEEASDIRDEDLVWVARFHYPDKNGANIYNATVQDSDVPELDSADERYNYNYTITGSRMVAPLKIFSDDEFTYMQFRNKNSVIPAIFMVDKYGNESLINYRMEGDYVVIERVASQFTLRHGDDVTCVFNESNPLPKAEKDNKFLGLF